MRSFLAIPLFALAVPLAAQETVTIGTVGMVPTGFVGIDNTFGLVGQVFKAPEGVSVLEYFRVYITDAHQTCQTCSPVAWEPTLEIGDFEATGVGIPLHGEWGRGPVLYTMPGATPATPGWLDFGFINLAVEPGRRYEARFWWGGPENVLVNFPVVPDASYSPGEAFECGPCSTLIATGPRDLLFEAQFSKAPDTTVTPEPLTMTLLGTGLAGIAAARRRRKKEAAL